MRKKIYHIMHKDRIAATIDETGHCRLICPDFMPYNLFLEEKEDIDSLVNNVTNFNYWCSSRILTLDRKYAKEILNSIGVMQAVTDKDRAKIALSCRCVSLTDVFWVKVEGEDVGFDNINLYENHLENTFIDIALRGRQYSVQNECLVRDLATNGSCPKAWQRVETGFRLLKDGDDQAVARELAASQICRCFDVSQVLYEEGFFDGERVSVSENMTTLEYAIVSMEAFEIYALNHDIGTEQFILDLDPQNYYMMNIIDYLVGNTDRHWGNWGILVDNTDNRPVCLHKLMDFNQAFHAYDQLDGANCQTGFGKHMTQLEAAIQAVTRIGFNQLREIDRAVFAELPQYRDMFFKRLGILKSIKT